MPDWVKELFNYGVLGIIVAGCAIVVWKRVLPWADRYIASTELLHEQIAKTMAKQGDLCDGHGEGISSAKRHLNRHDSVVRTACAMCRDVAAKHYPSACETVNRHCAEIERIIGEA